MKDKGWTDHLRKGMVYQEPFNNNTAYKEPPPKPVKYLPTWFEAMAWRRIFGGPMPEYQTSSLLMFGA